jgi:hypothetical protein
VAGEDTQHHEKRDLCDGTTHPTLKEKRAIEEPWFPGITLKTISLQQLNVTETLATEF